MHHQGENTICGAQVGANSHSLEQASPSIETRSHINLALTLILHLITVIMMKKIVKLYVVELSGKLHG